jgi:hypothetical protein
MWYKLPMKKIRRDGNLYNTAGECCFVHAPFATKYSTSLGMNQRLCRLTQPGGFFLVLAATRLEPSRARRRPILVFHFKLTAEEMKTLDNMDQGTEGALVPQYTDCP